MWCAVSCVVSCVVDKVKTWATVRPSKLIGLVYRLIGLVCSGSAVRLMRTGVCRRRTLSWDPPCALITICLRFSRDFGHVLKTARFRCFRELFKRFRFRESHIIDIKRNSPGLRLIPTIPLGIWHEDPQLGYPHLYFRKQKTPTALKRFNRDKRQKYTFSAGYALITAEWRQNSHEKRGKGWAWGTCRSGKHRAFSK